MQLSKLWKQGLSFLGDVYYRTRVLTKLGYYDRLSDSDFLKTVFPKYMDYPLDLENPKSFSEKLQWLKIHNRKPIHTKMVDKYEAKSFITEAVGAEYVIPAIGVWDSVDDIDFDSLPPQFVLKCTHDSGGLVICKDRKTFDIEAAKKTLQKSLSRDYYRIAREWAYHDVPRRIIAEPYMAELGEKNLLDYKMFVFNGQPKLTIVCSDRFSKNGTKMNFYDLDWKPMKVGFRLHELAVPEFPRPQTFDDMLRVARILSKDCPFIRIDFYEINGHLYVGELTLFPGAGFEPFRSIDMDYEVGGWLDLETVHWS